MKNNLKQIRESFGKLQEDVAADIGIALSTYRSWEQGSRSLNGDKISMLADYYRVSTDTILGTKYGQLNNSECSDIVDDDEINKLLRTVKLLNDEGMAKLLGYADDLVSSGKYEKKEMQDHPFSSRAAIA